MMMPARTNTTIAICIQIHVGDMHAEGSPSAAEAALPPERGRVIDKQLCCLSADAT
jgi:hypothetical protein